jgi:CDP-paratose 2-epimerase
MKILITGGAGFLGSNLAAEVLKRGEQLTVFDNLSRTGCAQNLEWLKTLGSFQFLDSDIRNFHDVDRAIQIAKPDVIFHLAGQVAMTTSIDNPRLDFETNVVGSHNVLHSASSRAPEALIVYSSTNKVYGDLEQFEYVEGPKRYTAKGFDYGFDEQVGLDFRSPYGCSKGAADQYMLDYARVFKMRTVVFRHSSIFGGRQFSTFDQGWIGWFVRQALEQKANPSKAAFTISGNGKQVRDVLFADDLVNCYFSAVRNADKAVGQAFNIGGGAENSLSLLELFDFLEQKVGVKLKYDQLPWRQSDQKVFVADIRKAEKLLSWKPRISKAQGLEKMIDWVASNVR